MMKRDIKLSSFEIPVRWAAGFFGIAAWGISIYFNVLGFNFDVPGMQWIGLVLGCGITILELIWNRGYTRGHLGLFLAGIIAYAWGTYTNVIGVSFAAGGSDISFGHMVLGTFLEFVPEPCIIFAILGKDLVDTPWYSGIFNGRPKMKSLRPNLGDTPPARQTTRTQGYDPLSKPYGNRPTRVTPTEYSSRFKDRE